MSFLSGLKVFGHDIEKVFAFITSNPAVKAAVTGGEAIVEAFVPASIPIFDVMNAWGKKVFAIEALAAAAGKANGTGVDKAVDVINAIDPEIMAYVKQMNLSPRTDAQIQAANDAIVAFLNAMTATNPVEPPTPA